MPEVTSVDSIVNLDPRLTKEQYQALYANPAQIPNPAIAQALSKLSTQRTTLITVNTDLAPVLDEAENLVRQFP